MLSKLKSGVQVTSGLEVVLKQEESHKAHWQGMVTGHPHLERGDGVWAGSLCGAQGSSPHLSHT